ncbi:MAG TPA: hypothetical protein VK765_01525, partial [Solirubrobacteraceae bacterium]|nr:hypothetical protein [Solirubrobacteraceae bacterium]
MDRRVVEWLGRNESELAVDPVILGEIRFGILLLPPADRPPRPCSGCTRRTWCAWRATCLRPRSGSNTCPTACFTLCSAWLTACLTPGEIAYAATIATIPTAAITSARRARPRSPSGEAGRTLNGEMAMLNKTLVPHATARDR